MAQRVLTERRDKNGEIVGWNFNPTVKMRMWCIYRIKPEFKQDNAFDTGMALFKTRTRFSNGWSDWRGIWGSLGDGAAYSG